MLRFHSAAIQHVQAASIRNGKELLGDSPMVAALANSAYALHGQRTRTLARALFVPSHEGLYRARGPS